MFNLRSIRYNRIQHVAGAKLTVYRSMCISVPTSENITRHQAFAKLGLNDAIISSVNAYGEYIALNYWKFR